MQTYKLKKYGFSKDLKEINYKINYNYKDNPNKIN